MATVPGYFAPLTFPSRTLSYHYQGGAGAEGGKEWRGVIAADGGYFPVNGTYGRGTGE